MVDQITFACLWRYGGAGEATTKEEEGDGTWR